MRENTAIIICDILNRVARIFPSLWPKCR